MKKKSTIALICISLMAMSFILVQNWNIVQSNQITFKLGSLNGSIGGLKGAISFDPADLGATNLDVTLDVSTITTGNSLRDRDIKNEKGWFDIANYPKISFKSSSITKTTTGYIVNGILTMKGISKPVQIPFAFVNASTGGTFSGTLKINHFDYKVGKPSMFIKDTVDVTIMVPVKK